MAKPPNPPGAGANGQGHGDIDALYRAHAGDLVAWLRKMFGDGPPEPEDMAQQAFLKLMERPDRADMPFCCTGQRACRSPRSRGGLGND